MDQELRAIPEGERVIVGGYLYGHVGISREAIERIHGGWGRVIVGGYLYGHVGISREAIERIHGGWGVGENNEDGERV